MAAIYPMKDEVLWWKRIIGSIIISALISLLFILISKYNILGMSFSSAFIIIGVITIMLSIDAFEGYMRKSKLQEDVKKNGKTEIYNLNHSIKDLYIIIVLTLLSLTIVALPTKYIEGSILYPIKTVFSVLIIFLSGYAFWAAVIPLIKLGRFKRLLLTIIFGIILLTISYFLLKFNTLNGLNIVLISILSAFIGLMCIIAFVRRKRKPKTEKKESKYDEKSSFTPYEITYEEKEESKTPVEDVNKSKPILADKTDQISDIPDGTENSKRKFISLDLILILLATALSLVFILTPKYSGTIINTILRIILILFLPGYSLIAALYPKKDDLDVFERLSLSFAIPLLGLAVVLTVNTIHNISISLHSVLLLLAIFTILLTIIAYIRRILVLKKENSWLIDSNKSQNKKESVQQKKLLQKLESIEPTSFSKPAICNYKYSNYIFNNSYCHYIYCNPQIE